MDNPGKSKSVETRHNLLSLFCVIVLATCHAVATGSEIDEFLAYKRKTLGPLEAEFNRISLGQEHDTGMKRFEERLALIDEVAKLLIGRLHYRSSRALGGILAEIIDTPKSAGIRGYKAAPLDADGIYGQFIDQFSAELPAPAVSQKDLAFLREYYNAAITVSERYIMEHGSAARVVEEDVEREIVELYIVMRFLHVADRRWSSLQIDSLPGWMKKSEPLRIFEDFSLRLKRPFAATAFAQYGKDDLWDNKKKIEYLGAKSRLFTSIHKYRLAICCYEAGIEVAAKGGAEEGAMRMSISLARLYENMSYPKLAASTLKQALQVYLKSSEWGKAAMLRLKYLYASEEFQKITQEAPGYQVDDRCKSYLPQIMYIAWVTYRRQNKPKAAAELQKTFLEKFPAHPLTADLYFGSAMSALARGDYAEAMRLLEIIEYRFPDSRVIGKAKRIQERLRKRAPSEAKR